jgi:hypothetical protein
MRGDAHGLVTSRAAPMADQLIAFKLKLAFACVAGLAGPLAVAPLLSDAGLRGGASGTEQAIVEVRAGNVAYRVAGDFTRNGKQAAAPLRQVTFESRFTS